MKEIPEGYIELNRFAILSKGDKYHHGLDDEYRDFSYDSNWYGKTAFQLFRNFKHINRVIRPVNNLRKVIGSPFDKPKKKAITPEPPENFEIVKDLTYALKKGDKYYYKYETGSQWATVTGYAGTKLGDYREHCGPGFKVCRKIEKPYVPKFPTNKPFPYGY